MHKPITDLASARILIANDDGIGAPGIKLLERIARALSKDVWVVAPEFEQSAAAHSLTIRRPLRVRQVSRRRFSVDGTPTDAVLIAVRHILKDKRPDLVLSGINRGANLGDDVTYSGTVAAAIEGTLLGIPSMALSQEGQHNHPMHWSTAERYASEVVRRAAAIGWGRNVLINVNFPDCPHEEVSGIEVVRQGKRKLGDQMTERLDPRGDPYLWIAAQRLEDRAEKGTDLEAVYRGAIAITPLSIDLTHRETVTQLKAMFE